MIKKILSTLFIFIQVSIVSANNSDSLFFSGENQFQISDTTYDCILVTNSKSTYKRVNLFGLNDSSLRVLNKNVSHKMLIDSIKSITFYGRGFWKGAYIGGGIGMVLGLIVGGSSNISFTGDGGSSKYDLGRGIGAGALLAIPFGLIGGGLGALFAEDRFYDLSKLDFPAKKEQIEFLMRKYSNK
jgi:hypothetical protein